MISFLLIICTIACLILASLIVFQEIRRASNILFVGICLCFAMWSLSIMVFLGSNNSSLVFFSAKVFYFAAGLFPVLLLLFALLFPKKYKHTSKITITFIGILGAIVAFFVIFAPQFIIIDTVVSKNGNYAIIEPKTYIIYSIYFVSLFVIAMLIALHKFIIYRGKMRMQAGLYALGILLNSIPGFVTNLYLPYHGNYDLIWVGPIASVCFLSLTAYGIIMHGLFSIRAAAVRSTAYIFTLATLTLIYYLLAYFATSVFTRLGIDGVISFGPINIVLALILAFLFQPIRKFFDKFTGKVFFKDEYSVDEFFASLNKTLSSTTDLRRLLERVACELSNALKSEQLFFYVENSQHRHLTIGTVDHKKLPIEDALYLHKTFGASPKIIVQSLLTNTDPVRRLMISHQLELVMPLVQAQKLVGYVCIGHHRTSGYSNRDLKLLMTISDELVIAIQNALSIQEVKDLNSSLEQRIETATKELRASNAQLQKLDEAKDEFISMASHQLRTPLTSIKGYVSMLMDGDVGEVSEEQKHLLQEAFMSSERMVRLIGDFLNVSRLQTGKFVIDKHPVDLAKIVSEEVEGLQTNAQSRGLSFTFKKLKNIPELNLDENKIHQVIMNFCDNAIYYSKENSNINVSLAVVNNQVEFSVKDTGIGVPADEQAQLFNKFFRATNARKQRPDGTGVGLFLAKKVIDAHDGKIVFESEEGKGSTFGFRLPIKK